MLIGNFVIIPTETIREKTDKWEERLETRDETQDMREKRDEGCETRDGRRIMKNRT